MLIHMVNRGQPPVSKATESVRHTQPRKSLSKRGSESHLKILRIVSKYGNAWQMDENLMEICEKLDREGVPVPAKWACGPEPVTTTWTQAFKNDAFLVFKTIRDRCMWTLAKRMR